MYLLFGGADYEEGGGVRDLWGSYTSYSLAAQDIKFLVEFFSKHGDGVWWHIYSVEDDDIIRESE